MLLAAASGFFGYQAYGVWSANDEPVVRKADQKPSNTRGVRRGTYRRNQPSTNFEVIPQKDLFSSDRREKLPEKPKTTAPVKAAQPLDRRFALFGIVIEDSEKKALVANLGKKSAKDKAYIWVKVGDKIGNFDVSEIQPEQIILTQGESVYSIRLSDPNKPKKRSVTRKRTKRTNTTNKTKPKTKNSSGKASDEAS
jgi:hypothetical protein